MGQRLKEKGPDKHNTVILMCRFGARSAKAVGMPALAGYTRVFTLVKDPGDNMLKHDIAQHGHMSNGWEVMGLAWVPAKLLGSNKLYEHSTPLVYKKNKY